MHGEGKKYRQLVMVDCSFNFCNHLSVKTMKFSKGRDPFKDLLKLTDVHSIFTRNDFLCFFLTIEICASIMHPGQFFPQDAHC